MPEAKRPIAHNILIGALLHSQKLLTLHIGAGGLQSRRSAAIG
jgi:hypothetical protein